MIRNIVLLLATGLRLGLSPYASGTVATLVLGIPIAVAMAGLSLPAYVIVSILLTAAAFPLCGKAEDYLGRKDDHRIVADEYLTFPLCLIGLPWQNHLWLLGLAFVTHRVMDIVKPPPARQAQILQGGLGIVLDDVIASFFALAVNHLVWALVSRL